jgi:hypothetical protein
VNPGSFSTFFLPLSHGDTPLPQNSKIITPKPLYPDGFLTGRERVCFNQSDQMSLQKIAQNVAQPSFCQKYVHYF